ncbi:MAG: bifunctional phosphoglucose/phosphomannose isomerase [Candidatus Saccharibacteria bacterium]|nr:bifunctional phosphoglucose/phosphomannose isomerase [Candidatus Saccharibacteria bacterium]
MLDDLKYIHHKDAEDALGLAGKQWQQLLHDFSVELPKRAYTNVVHSGMGGTAAWALLAKQWPGFSLPFEVVQDYDVPGYVSAQTLFIAASYSGNTEETLSALRQAEGRGAAIVVMTSGGQLLTIAREKGYPLIELPKIARPRFGTLYGLKALISVGQAAHVLQDASAMTEFSQLSDFLQDQCSQWSPDVPTAKNLAKQIAHEIMGRTAVMYSGPLLQAAAHKWKLAINENAHNLAWEGTLPEFSHNEFTGWTSHPLDKPFAVLFLQSSLDNDRVQKRYDISERLLSGRWPAPEHIEAAGKTLAEQLLWTTVLGDFVSIYLALLNGRNPIDPSAHDIVEKLKKEMGEYHG